MIRIIMKQGCKPIFIEQKQYRTYMQHLNKVESTNFVDDNEILVGEKYYFQIVFLIAQKWNLD